MTLIPPGRYTAVVGVTQPQCPADNGQNDDAQSGLAAKGKTYLDQQHLEYAKEDPG